MAKEVLILGGGMVSGPCIDYLIRNQVKVTVVTAAKEDLKRVQTLYPTTKVILLDIEQETKRLKDVMKNHDIVISLLPDHLHRLLASCCIECQKSLVHVSYEGQAIRDLSSRAEEAGITILSEVGLDPGIDHMITKSCIDSVRKQGGEITGYISLCGGLPAPEFSHGPLRYKFSWYPKGMLMDGVASATYIENSQLIDVPGGHVFDSPVLVNDLLEGETLEYVPNGNAALYKEAYDIPSATTLYRGTLRYKGFSKQFRTIIDLGLFRDDNLSELFHVSPTITWRELICKLLGFPEDSTLNDINSFLKVTFGHSETDVETLIKLGILSDEEVARADTTFDALCSLLTKKLAYEPGERDMIILRTIIQTKLPNGQKQQHIYDLVEMGQTNGFSAMARTVGVTAAISACLVLEGAVKRKGAILPVTSDIYQPILERLAKEGIEFKSSVTDIS